MKLYWQERKSGQRLILSVDDESEIEVGAVRQTPRGVDALAKTTGYDPGRAQKGFVTIEEAKAFVESFHPWDLFGGDWDMEVELEVRGIPVESSTPAVGEPSHATAPAEPSTPAETLQTPRDEQPSHATAPVQPSTPAETLQTPRDEQPSHATAPAEPSTPAETLQTPRDELSQATAPAEPSTPAETLQTPRDEPSQPSVEEKQSRKPGWQFWKKG